MSVTEATAPVEYREIPGFPGYWAGDDGSVWTAKRQGGTRPGRIVIGWQITGHRKRMKLSSARGGYLKISLCRQGRYTTKQVHVLILETFVGQKPPGQECRHLNGNRRDNRLMNLQWGTRIENFEDRDLHGKTVRGERSTQAKLTDSDVIDIRNAVANGVPHVVLAGQFNVSRTLIRNVAQRRNWRHIP